MKKEYSFVRFPNFFINCNFFNYFHQISSTIFSLVHFQYTISFFGTFFSFIFQLVIKNSVHQVHYFFSIVYWVNILKMKTKLFTSTLYLQKKSSNFFRKNSVLFAYMINDINNLSSTLSEKNSVLGVLSFL